MHVYMIFAHPSRRSFSRRALDAFTKVLAEAGHSYEMGDLYRMDFQSEMDEAQYLSETSGEPNPAVPPDVREGQARIDRAHGLAFNDPVWWTACPARLKVWFDRVLTCGCTCIYDAAGLRAREEV